MLAIDQIKSICNGVFREFLTCNEMFMYLKYLKMKYMYVRFRLQQVLFIVKITLITQYNPHLS